jgi:iron complex outermembrane recepter protein
VYLNNVDRIDEDQAIFGSVSFDITDQWELTLGARYFEPENSVKGYFGFGLGFSPACEPGICTDDEGELIGLGEDEPGAVANGGSGAYSPDGQDWSKNGEWRCASQEDYKDAPCLNVDRRIKESEYIGRVNLTWKPADGYMMYATWSEGYRPGGINRDPTYPDYVSDFLTNWELGWKTAWLDNTLQFNGAVFLQEWDDVQVSFAGDNGITLVNNGPTAEVAGIEMQALWMPLDGLRLSTSVAYYDSELQDVYCEDSDCESSAPAGSQLPLTPEFKGNLIGRYEFPLAGFDANVQGAVAYESSRPSDIIPDNNEILGDIPSSTVLDLSAGIGRDSWALDLFIGNVTNEDAPTAIGLQCAIGTCGPQTYGIRTQPRTIGLKFSQEF